MAFGLKRVAVSEDGEMRAVIGEWCRKDNDDGCHHGRTRPDMGTVVYQAGTRPDQTRRALHCGLGIGPKIQKAGRLFEPHTVWNNLLLALAGDGGRGSALARETFAERAELKKSRNRPAARPARARRAGSVAWPEAMAGIGMLLAQERGCCWSTNRCGDD